MRTQQFCYEAISHPESTLVGESLSFEGDEKKSTTFTNANQAIKTGNDLRKEFLLELRNENNGPEKWSDAVLAMLCQGSYTIGKFEKEAQAWNSACPDEAPANPHVTNANYVELKNKWRAFLKNRDLEDPRTYRDRHD